MPLANSPCERVSWPRDMKAAYYTLCAIPSLCLFVSWITPNNFNAGGPSVMLQFGLLAAMMLLSPVFTLLGIIGIVGARDHKESAVWPCVATALAAFPGILLLWQKLSSTP
jgi:hypothetical protein